MALFNFKLKALGNDRTLYRPRRTMHSPKIIISIENPLRLTPTYGSGGVMWENRCIRHLIKLAIKRYGNIRLEVPVNLTNLILAVALIGGCNHISPGNLTQAMQVSAS